MIIIHAALIVIMLLLPLWRLETLENSWGVNLLQGLTRLGFVQVQGRGENRVGKYGLQKAPDALLQTGLGRERFQVASR